MNVEPSRFFVPKRHVRVSSPGRVTTDVLNTSDQPSPVRKVRDNLKSSIMNTGVGIDTNGNLRRATLSPRHQDNTKNRLFGGDGDANGSPRRNNDTWRSHIMFSDSNGQALQDSKRTPKKRIPSGGNVNPITGSPLQHANGSNGRSSNGVNGHHFDHDDVLTVTLGSEGNGPVAMLNGHSNGDHYPSTPRRRPAQMSQ